MTKNIYGLLSGLIFLFSTVRPQEQAVMRNDSIYNALVVLYKNNQLNITNIKKLQQKTNMLNFCALLELRKNILQKEWNEEYDKLINRIPRHIVMGLLLQIIVPPLFLLVGGWVMYSDYYKYFKYKETKQSEIDLLNCIREKIQHIELIQALTEQNNTNA